MTSFIEIFLIILTVIISLFLVLPYFFKATGFLGYAILLALVAWIWANVYIGLLPTSKTKKK